MLTCGFVRLNFAFAMLIRPSLGSQSSGALELGPYFTAPVLHSARTSQCSALGPNPRSAGAGDGNRTRTTSLEGWGSPSELHPHANLIQYLEPHLPLSICRQWWRGLDLNQRRRSQRIYSPPPLTTRAPLRRTARATGAAM